jgi:hypothetical protein
MAKKIEPFSVSNSVKRKAAPRGQSFKPGNPWRIKPGEVRNATGRPKLLGDAYREWLAHGDEFGVTNAAKVAIAVGALATKGDIQSAKELRQATEGDRLTFDVSQLSEAQLERIASGENPANVLSTTSGSGVGTEATPSTVDGEKLPA